MIELYSGTPGSGKSYHATERIYYALRSGKNVISNFDFDLSKIRHCRGHFSFLCNVDLNIKNLLWYASQYHEDRKESQTLIVIDEAGVKFNARSWQDSDRMGWLDFFSQHRKLGFDVLLIAQSDQMIDKQIRSFIEVEHLHRKLRSSGFLIGFFLSFFAAFVDVKFFYANHMKTGTDFLRYRKKIALMYDSFSTFGGLYGD